MENIISPLGYRTRYVARRNFASMATHAPIWIRELSKGDLRSLVADTKTGDMSAVGRSVEFVIHESFGNWHNRARAKLCRFFKNHPPDEDECARMVDAVCTRLITGKFYEQFNDQLSMAIRFDCERMTKTAFVAANSERDYIRRYGARVLHAIDSIPSSENAE